MMRKQWLFVLVLAALCCLGVPSSAYGTLEGDQESLSESELQAAVARGEVGPFEDEPAPASARSSSFAESYAGETRFDTAAAQALAAYDSSEYVVLVGDGGWADALSGTGLAGLLDCPILLTSRDSLSPQAASAIRSLGASRAVVLGGGLMVSDRVVSDLKGMGLGVERLAGETRQDTQLAVYEYGLRAPRGASWSGDTVAFASGQGFHDALSFSPAAFSGRVPVFLAGADGGLTGRQREALSGRRFATAVVLGGDLVMSRSTEEFASSLCSSGRATRIAGATRYDTSAAVAEWAVSTGRLGWDGAAFAASSLPYDALAGSVLQGRSRAVLLIVDGSAGTGPAVSAAAAHAGSISGIRLFGGTLSISEGARKSIMYQLTHVSYAKRSISFASFFEKQKAVINGLASWSQEERDKQLSLLQRQLDPKSFEYGTPEFFQFARLDEGYSGFSAAQLDAFIETSGSDEMLSGMGQAFVDASRRYGINEVYLLAHAILESGWGTSQLAQGFQYDGKTPVGGKAYPAGTYYNFFGIGAVDSGPLSGGRALAVKQGWNSPQKAILGAAAWISANYIRNSFGPQNTLYLMKWDLFHAENGSTPWHQYATSTTWATGIARVMNDCYLFSGKNIRNVNLSFVVPEYK